MTTRLLAASIALGSLLLGSAGCQDPCAALAARICNCQLTLAQRQACTQDRITNVNGRLEVTDEARSVCTAALDTCDCQALDENRTEACGFVPAVPE